MSELTPIPSDFEEDHFPLRGGDWLINGNEELAQVKAIHIDKDYKGKPEFLVDLVLYEESGRRIGRKSISEPFTIGDKTYRGPRTYEPMCSLAGWTRIKTPKFPISREMISVPDPQKPNGRILRYGFMVEERKWGNYKRRVRKPATIVAVSKPNFDPELEKRALLIAAQNLRDIAREIGNEELRKRAEELEQQAAKY